MSGAKRSRTYTMKRPFRIVDDISDELRTPQVSYRLPHPTRGLAVLHPSTLLAGQISTIQTRIRDRWCARGAFDTIEYSSDALVYPTLFSTFPEDLFRFIIRQRWIDVHTLLTLMELNFAWYRYIRGKNELWVDLLQSYTVKEQQMLFPSRIRNQLEKDPYRRPCGYHYAMICRGLCHHRGRYLPCVEFKKGATEWYLGRPPFSCDRIRQLTHPIFFCTSSVDAKRQFVVLSPEQFYTLATLEFFMRFPYGESKTRSEYLLKLKTYLSDVPAYYREFGKSAVATAKHGLEKLIRTLSAVDIARLYRRETESGRIKRVQHFKRVYLPASHIHVCHPRRHQRVSPNYITLNGYLTGEYHRRGSIYRHVANFLNFTTIYVEAMDRFDCILSVQSRPKRLTRNRKPELRRAQAQRYRERKRRRLQIPESTSSDEYCKSNEGENT